MGVFEIFSKKVFLSYFSQNSIEFWEKLVFIDEVGCLESLLMSAWKVKLSKQPISFNFAIFGRKYSADRHDCGYSVTNSEEYKNLKLKKKECQTKIEPEYFQKNGIERKGRGDKKFLMAELGDSCDAVKKLFGE